MVIFFPYFLDRICLLKTKEGFAPIPWKSLNGVKVAMKRPICPCGFALLLCEFGDFTLVLNRRIGVHFERSKKNSQENSNQIFITFKYDRNLIKFLKFW
jgi:hypothetical protein